ncbi:MAG: hypothetical protein A2289_16535 [Deltaproteobacteria bacterium RIFOXYA12_FULL_58_15]|nr:MAG: hypothetical protein A2289_16535 [Deltaproteobacteria bacterium RIFOXYA12_FULL_58_15]OGR09074.1 MAG: hypothetical protein A2341_25975 [Deltaproteobacteria bacterium RIFOXYB12_FULL_58_9]
MFVSRLNTEVKQKKLGGRHLWGDFFGTTISGRPLLVVLFWRRSQRPRVERLWRDFVRLLAGRGNGMAVAPCGKINLSF